MLPRFIPENQRTVALYSLKIAGWHGPKPPYTSTLLPPELSDTTNATQPELVPEDPEDSALLEDPAGTVSSQIPPNWHIPSIQDVAPHHAPAAPSNPGLIIGALAGSTLAVLVIGGIAFWVRRRAQMAPKRLRLPHIRDDDAPPRTSHCFTRGVSPLPCTSGPVWEGGWGIWVGLGLRIRESRRRETRTVHRPGAWGAHRCPDD